MPPAPDLPGRSVTERGKIRIMRIPFVSRLTKWRGSLSRQAIRTALLFMPLALLSIISLRTAGGTSLVLWAGTAVQGAACLLLLGTGKLRQSSAMPVVALYVLALAWLVIGVGNITDWFANLAQAALLVVPLAYFARQCLRDSGAAEMRRARQLAAQIGARKDWPADLLACRLLPEVKALRQAIHFDASPALDLLVNPRPSVRVAALAALEFRTSWRGGQPQIVLQLAQRATEPEIRAVAVNALANIDDRLVLEALATLLRDPSSLVRLTTAEALLWNTERRWNWIRDSLHNALADPVGQNDGPLRISGSQMTAQALADLHSWAAEKGSTGVRATLTLGSYYGRVLAAGNSPELAEQLRKCLIDSKTSPLLRLELARLLHQYHELDGPGMLELLSPSMPAPVRLLAAEALLSKGTQCPEALAALHDLARLPNREIALSTAEVVQRRLGIDMGLPRNQGLPPLHSRAATEIARRVLAWASQHEVGDSLAVGGGVRDASGSVRDGSGAVRSTSRVELG